jgi:hypothetical protein
MSPYEIKLLLDIYCIPDWGSEKAYTPILNSTIEEFKSLGLVEDNRLTDRGIAHVSHICNLPLPCLQKIYVDAHGIEIKLL